MHDVGTYRAAWNPTESSSESRPSAIEDASRAGRTASVEAGEEIWQPVRRVGDGVVGLCAADGRLPGGEVIRCAG